MTYVLVAHTRGDELISSQDYMIEASSDRQKLEELKERREREREEWLMTHSVPWWQECSLISNEEIKEVPTAFEAKTHHRSCALRNGGDTCSCL